MVQLSAVNTPQFDWVLSRLPHRAQPVPPIFPPELAATAIPHAADNPNRAVRPPRGGREPAVRALAAPPWPGRCRDRRGRCRRRLGVVAELTAAVVVSRAG